MLKSKTRKYPQKQALVDFEALFKCKEQIRKIEGVEQTEYFLGPIYPKWPLNLFPFLLERKN
jgi:hypothetical protein